MGLAIGYHARSKDKRSLPFVLPPIELSGLHVQNIH